MYCIIETIVSIVSDNTLFLKINFNFNLELDP